MSPVTILDLSSLVCDGQLFTPPGDRSRVEAFIPTPFLAQQEDPHRTHWPRRRWSLTLALAEDGGAT